MSDTGHSSALSFWPTDLDTSARVWALLNNVGRKGNIGCVLPGVDGLVV